MMQIPIFPLQIVAFPFQETPLHIFEPRYRKMINECVETKRLFGIMPVYKERVASLGTAMQVKEVVNRYPDGRLDIVASGQFAFRVNEFIIKEAGEDFHEAIIEPLDLSYEPEELLTFTVAQFYRQFHQLIGSGQALELKAEQPTSFQLALTSGLEIGQQVQMLEMATEETRLLFLIEHFKKTIPILTEARQTRELAMQNGHFKAFPSQAFKFHDDGETI